MRSVTSRLAARGHRVSQHEGVAAAHPDHAVLRKLTGESIALAEVVAEIA
jgi:hypothetical protein